MIFMDTKFCVRVPNLGSAGVPPVEPGVAPGSRSTNLNQLNEASGATPDAARETRALPKMNL